MKCIYLHSSIRASVEGDGSIAAVILSGDIDGKQMLGVKIERMTEYSTDAFTKALTALRFGLQYVYEIQESLKNAGFDTVVIVTSKDKLYNNIINPTKTNAHQLNMYTLDYRFGGIKEIELSLALGQLVNYDVAYKYCKDVYADSELIIKGARLHICDKRETEEIIRQRTDAQKKAERAVETSMVSALDMMKQIDESERKKDIAPSEYKIAGIQ